MLLKLIDDINRAVDHECYFVALAVALTLPDICGKAEYPNEKSTKRRYIQWYDENVGKFEKNPSNNDVPYLSGEVVYSLRCSLLHQGNPNIESDDIKEDVCKIDHFTLLIEKKNKFDIYMDTACVRESFLNEQRIVMPERSYDVNIRRLCMILSLTAKGYYNKCKDKFDFFNFRVIDIDKNSPH